MIRQQLQSGLSIFSLKGINTYGANRKPNCAGECSFFVPLLDLVNPISADWLALYKDRVSHHGALSISEKERRSTLFSSVTEASWAG
jgi:hypothetical protein